MACEDGGFGNPEGGGGGGLGNAGWREPASSDRLPSIGVSLQPAIPRRVACQQSPLPLHQSPTIVAQSQCGVWLRSSVALVVSAPNGGSSLLCAPGVISILRRHLCGGSARGGSDLKTTAEAVTRRGGS